MEKCFVDSVCPPLRIQQAAVEIGHWFADNNIKHWELANCASRDSFEQLRQRVAELEKERDAALETIKQQHRIHVELVEEKEVAEAKADEEQKHSCKMAYQRDIANVEITTLKAALKVARDGIDEFLVANDPTEFGCVCGPSVDYLCGPCHTYKQQQPLKSALAKINEVLHD